MQKSKRLVLISVLCVLFVWLGINYSRITEFQNGFVRLVLGLIFGLSVLFRWKKPVPGDDSDDGGWSVPVFSIVGGIMVVLGLIFPVHQIEWIGLLLLCFVSLSWAFPARYKKDIAIALFLIYWIHPLPGPFFARAEFFMQLLSVKGAEWLLHCANVRVWADGMILHTGLRALGVPEACSGMKTALTVLLCTMGVGALFRFRWYETLVFVVAGMVQVLFLNVLRISFMVVWSARMPVEWGDNFLHDSLGIFLLITIVLVQIEASIWKVWSERKRSIDEAIARDEVEPPEEASVLPAFWRFLQNWGILVVALTLIVGIVSFVAYKKRAQHRAAMITDVVDGLLETNLDAAGKAIEEGLRLSSNTRYLLGRKALLMVLRNHHQSALDIIEELPAPLSIEEKILKSWALMATGASEEAVQLIESLPEDVKKQAGVAIIRAEYGARRDMPEVVRDNVIQASKLHTTIGRVRNLFPYMASRELWGVIADCENTDVPYTTFSHALISIHANITVNRMNTAATILKKALVSWPNEPRFLSSLHTLAMRDPGGEWEQLFADNLMVNLDSLDADRLASYISFSFQINRPDLAWMAMIVLSELDSNDPALLLAPINYGHIWFTFRRQHMGLESEDKDIMIDLRDVYLQTRDLVPVNTFWDNIPFADEIAENDHSTVRAKYVKKCLVELNKRRDAGKITRRMRFTYPTVLANASRFEEAHKMLDDLRAEYPGMRKKIMLEHARLYDRRQEWQKSYEVLKDYNNAAGSLDIGAELMTINSLMNMNMGICAMHVAERAKRLFPESSKIDAAVASIWTIYGFKEEAMMVLDSKESLRHSPAMIQLLHDTGRKTAAQKLSRVLGINIVRKDKDDVGSRVVPAELSIMRRMQKPFSDEDMDSLFKERESLLKTVKSDFLGKLISLELNWLKARGRGNTSDTQLWENAAENDIERVASLNRLGLLLARQKQYKASIEAFEKAIKIMPDSAMLWRILISVSEGDPKVVNRAIRACPNDSEIWLAYLVSRMNEQGAGEWIDKTVSQVLRKDIFSVQSLVRASDYLFRRKLVGPATRLARKSVQDANGYLPAYMMGVKCAHAFGDLDWGLVCALAGADNSSNPTPFYKVIATIGASGKRMTADVLAALEYLQEHYTDDAIWAEQLGTTYFEKGDTARALSILWPAIHEHLSDMDPRSLMIAAEAARHQGRGGDELSILVAARAKHPKDPKLLNNLVYALSRNKETLPRAIALLPALLEKGAKDFIVYDTVAMVYLRSGDVKKAKEYMAMALKLLDNDNYSAREVKLNSAELMLNTGEYKRAKKIIDDLRKEQGVSQMHELRSRELLRKIEQTVTTDVIPSGVVLPAP